MPVKFGDAERNVLNMFYIGMRFIHDGKAYTVTKVGKPTCSKGEPKTDVFILSISPDNQQLELKISFKKKNADFLENKMSAERALQLFGDEWTSVIQNATRKIKPFFENKYLIYKDNFKRTKAGAITLGWKFELLNKKSGELSDKIKLTKNQVKDVYAGTNLPIDKKDAYVNGDMIPDSGVANYILFEEEEILTVNDVLTNMVSIDDYVNLYPNVYFACKALNYRSFQNKYDGNRPLAVYVDWYVQDMKLDYKLIYNTPLKQGGNIVFKKLKDSLNKLNIENTDQINKDNTNCSEKIFQK